MIRTLTPEELARWDGFGALPPAERARLAPGSRWLETGRMMHFVAERDGRYFARASAFVNPRMQDQELPTGLVGCLDSAPGALEDEAAAVGELLGTAFRWLVGQGMRVVRAPVNFSTWNSYRAITFSTGAPAFLGENVLDARHGAFLAQRAGMKPVATYRSALVTDLERGQEVARLARLDQAESDHGIRVRWIERAGVAAELPMLHDLASRIFPLDWSFAPVSRPEFDELLFPVSQQVPDFQLLVAETGQGDPLGLCFGYETPGVEPRTAVLKTFGVLPEWQSKMISYLLAYRFHMRMIERGYRNFIHALMKEDNRSRHMSDHYATKFRGYTVFEKDL
jgi:hypothetical protein